MDQVGELHFTYCAPKGGLSQGDVLTKTDEVQALLREVHPHYEKADYSHLLVLTQTCDLVQRGGRGCRTRYVSLAAVRPLSLVLLREVERHQDDFAKAAGVCRKGQQSSIKRELEEFLERVLNNNEPEFFYLEPEVARGLVEPSCAFLRLSIAVRAADHYDNLVGARIMSLSDVFQAKLGWLVGNMYSRVGTPDWVPDKLPNRTQFKQKVDHLLGEVVHWVDDEQLALARDKAPPAPTTAQLREHVKQTIAPKKKDRILDAVLEVARRADLIPEDRATKLRNLLGNDPGLASLLK